MRDLNEIERPPELTDGRLRLRAVRPGDKAAVVAALSDPLAGRFLWQSPFPYADTDFDHFYSASRTFWGDLRLNVWIIEDAASGTLLACVSLSLDPEREAGELGYWAAPAARGTGAVSGAARLVRDWAFDGLGLQRLELTTDVGNLASQRVAQAVGMRREGVLRGNLTTRGRRVDEVVFGMLPGDPRAPLVPLPSPELEDGLLLLRPVAPEDAPDIARACADPAVAHWIHGLPAPYTLADAEAFVGRSEDDLVAGRAVQCAVLDCASGALLGSIGLRLFDADGSACGEIGYWTAPWARRRGVALSAARLLIPWAFERLGLERLEILTYPGNEASQQLAGKLGFTRVGLVPGFLPVEPGKDRAGRVVPSAGGSLPPRDDQVLFSLARRE